MSQKHSALVTKVGSDGHLGGLALPGVHAGAEPSTPLPPEALRNGKALASAERHHEKNPSSCTNGATLAIDNPPPKASVNLMQS